MSTSSHHLNADRDKYTCQPPASPSVLCSQCQCALTNDGGDSVVQYLTPVVQSPRIGGFGEVSVESLGEEGTLVAVKRPLPQKSYDFQHDQNSSCDTNIRCLILEAKVLMKLRHPNIQRVFDYQTDPPLIVMEFHKRGRLSEFIKRHPLVVCKPEWILRRSIELVSAMRYAHSMPWFVSHGDLNSTNVLLNDSGRVIVIDFGNVQTAREHPVFEQSPTLGNINTSRHAPEVIKSRDYGEKGDVFQTAIIMYELLTGTTPYKEEKSKHLLILTRQIAECGMRPEIPENLSQRPGWHPVLKNYLNLVKRCWSAYMEERPSFAELEEELTEILKEYKRATEILEEEPPVVIKNDGKLISFLLWMLSIMDHLASIPFQLLHIQQRAPLTESAVAAYRIIVSAFSWMTWHVRTALSSLTAVDDIIDWLNNKIGRSARALSSHDASSQEDTIAVEEQKALSKSPFDVRNCPFLYDDLPIEEELPLLNLPVPSAETWNRMCHEILKDLQRTSQQMWCIQLHCLCAPCSDGSPTEQDWKDFQKIFIDHPEARSCRAWVRYKENHNRYLLTRAELGEQGLYQYSDEELSDWIRKEDPVSTDPADFFAARTENADDIDEEVCGLSRTSTGVLTDGDLYEHVF